MRCPLPVDWLEYLEGSSSEDLSPHLGECTPCRVFVSALREDLPSRDRQHLTLRLTARWPQWRAVDSQPPVRGDIRWTSHLSEADSTSPTRLLLLLVSSLFQDAGHSWADVLPLSTDTENATSLDIVLASSDTTLGVPFRGLLRHQTVAQEQDLGPRVGTLTESGLAVLAEVLDGRAAFDRFGSAIDGSDDARLELSDGTQRAIQRLGRAYAIVQDEGIDAPQVTRQFIAYPMHRRVRRAASHQGAGLALAAASAVAEEQSVWSVQIPGLGQMAGRLEYRLLSDELLFIVDDVTQEQPGFGPVATLSFTSSKLAAPVTSEPFSPEPGHAVLLSQNMAVFPEEVSDIELRLADEH